MFKLQAIFHDRSVGLEFMTDSPSEAEEMRKQMLSCDFVAEVLLLEEPNWVKRRRQLYARPERAAGAGGGGYFRECLRPRAGGGPAWTERWR
jgi:hypothetical protein